MIYCKEILFRILFVNTFVIFSACIQAQEWHFLYDNINMSSSESRIYLHENSNNDILVAFSDALCRFDKNGTFIERKSVIWNTKNHLHKILYGDSTIVSVYSDHYNDYDNSLRIFDLEGNVRDSFDFPFYGRIRDVHLLEDTIAVFLTESWLSTDCVEKLKIINLNQRKIINQNTISNKCSDPDKFLINDKNEYVCFNTGGNFYQLFLVNENLELENFLTWEQYAFRKVIEISNDILLVYSIDVDEDRTTLLLIDKLGNVLKEINISPTILPGSDTSLGGAIDMGLNDDVILLASRNWNTNPEVVALICINQNVEILNHKLLDLRGPNVNSRAFVLSNIVKSNDGGFIYGTSYYPSEFDGIFQLIKFNANCDLDGVSSIYRPDSNNDIVIHPNPSNGTFYLESKESSLLEINKIEILDISGQLIKTISNQNLNAQVNVSDLSSGVYFVRFNNNNSSFVKRVVLQN